MRTTETNCELPKDPTQHLIKKAVLEREAAQVIPSFTETRWQRIVACYVLLEQASPSPLHTLNRAPAMAEWQVPAAGLGIITNIQPPSWLDDSYLWAAVMADLHRRCGSPLAQRYREQALQTAPNRAIQTALMRRLKPPELK